MPKIGLLLVQQIILGSAREVKALAFVKARLAVLCAVAVPLIGLRVEDAPLYLTKLLVHAHLHQLVVVLVVAAPARDRCVVVWIPLLVGLEVTSQNLPRGSRSSASSLSWSYRRSFSCADRPAPSGA